ncbi:ubx domain protein [Diplodia corticola]|uniref:Ubx domain protein n=1 Tax=Diplodia corticola TaxID=236234 RepID=A0A1J9RSH4_9PEZI|nr:ubx domain protein [Diplodia corticola]OJD30828.1 ubx domain protein [Diplodia corticola]
MAAPSVDIGQLSEDQQLALQQFTAVTDQAVEQAIPLLQRCQWNVQIAISRFFDGEPAEPVVPEESIPVPQDPRRRETLANGFGSSSRSSSEGRRNLEPAPRIVPQPENQTVQQVHLLLSVIIFPFRFVYGIGSRFLNLFSYLFPFLSRLFASRAASQGRRRDTSGRRSLSPRDTAARFIREFEEEYGSHELPFFEGGYAQAFDVAKKDLKFFLVILLSPEHDDTASHVRETLLAPEVVDFLKDPQNNIIVWAGNVQDAEAYQVSNALNCTKLPFAGLIVHTPSVSSTAMSVVARVVGPTPPSTFMSRLQTAIAQNSEPLNRVRATRAEQQAARNIRQAQDTAYERSLAQDRERAKQKREAEEAKRRAEQEERERQEAKEREARNLEQWRKWRVQSIPSEPGSDVQEVVRISLRMPSGDRVVRRFAPDTPIEDLYAFVECYDFLQDDAAEPGVEKPSSYDHEYKFVLVSPMPREEFGLEKGGTVMERIGRSGNLIVERTDLEDSEEEEE